MSQPDGLLRLLDGQTSRLSKRGHPDRRKFSSRIRATSRPPSTQLKALPGSGHVPIADDPRAVAGLIMESAARAVWPDITRRAAQRLRREPEDRTSLPYSSVRLGHDVFEDGDVMVAAALRGALVLVVVLAEADDAAP